MNTQATKITPIPLVNSAPINDDDRQDLAAFTGQPISSQEWATIRQCLRCLTQGKCIDSGDGSDDKPFIRLCTAEELKARGGILNGRGAVRMVAAEWKNADGRISVVTAARLRTFTPAGLTSHREWDQWWSDQEKAKADRRAE